MNRPPDTEGQQSVARYAAFARRLRALVIDAALVMGIVAALVIGADFADSLPGYGRGAWLIMFCALFLYEPVFVWQRGATVGHALCKITVVDERSGEHPRLWQAFTRYFLKLLLGIPSFVTMALTKKHQAVHDMLTKTTVQLRRDVPLDAGDFHLERDEEPVAGLPSKGRRTAVMILYLVALFLLYGVLLAVTDPLGCLRDQSCPVAIRLLADAMSVLWMVLSLATIIAAWKGLLPGARVRPGADRNSLVV